jgi:hypothetical protein
MNQRRTVIWALVLAAVLGVLISYYAIWLLVAYFAAGLVWWTSAALFVSGPLGVVGAVLAWRKPRERLAFAIGSAAAVAWVALWTACFTVFGFRVTV